MEAASDEAEDGSIPDLTEVDSMKICHRATPGTKNSNPTNAKEIKNSKNTEDHDKFANTKETKYKEAKEKIEGSCGKLCKDIKTAFNNTHCLDTNIEEGIYMDGILSCT